MTRYITDSIPTDADMDALHVERILTAWRYLNMRGTRKAAVVAVNALRKIGALK